MTDVKHLLHQIWQNKLDSLLRYGRCSFPSLDEGRVMDAVVDAFEMALVNPGLILAVHRDGDEAVLGVLRLFIWRGARAQIRRHAYARSVSVAAMHERTQSPSQEFLTHVSLRLEDALRCSTEEVNARHANNLRGALVDALVSGESEAAVALRHGVRREHINKARRRLNDILMLAA